MKSCCTRSSTPSSPRNGRRRRVVRRGPDGGPAALGAGEPDPDATRRPVGYPNTQPAGHSGTASPDPRPPGPVMPRRGGDEADAQLRSGIRSRSLAGMTPQRPAHMVRDARPPGTHPREPPGTSISQVWSGRHRRSDHTCHAGDFQPTSRHGRGQSGGRAGLDVDLGRLVDLEGRLVRLGPERWAAGLLIDVLQVCSSESAAWQR